MLEHRKFEFDKAILLILKGDTPQIPTEDTSTSDVPSSDNDIILSSETAMPIISQSTDWENLKSITEQMSAMQSVMTTIPHQAGELKSSTKQLLTEVTTLTANAPQSETVKFSTKQHSTEDSTLTTNVLQLEKLESSTKAISTEDSVLTTTVLQLEEVASGTQPHSDLTNVSQLDELESSTYQRSTVTAHAALSTNRVQLEELKSNTQPASTMESAQAINVPYRANVITQASPTSQALTADELHSLTTNMTMLKITVPINVNQVQHFSSLFSFKGLQSYPEVPVKVYVNSQNVSNPAVVHVSRMCKETALWQELAITKIQFECMCHTECELMTTVVLYQNGLTPIKLSSCEINTI